MNREKRFEIIAVSEKASICELAEEILQDTEVKILKEHTGMIMARASDSVAGAVFNLGEVLVTEAEVEIGGEKGYAMVLGMEPEKARAGAILDAAVETNHPLKNKILETLEEERKKAEERKRKLWGMVKPTKVEFEVMR
ncbi:MAG TPA: phosphonate C-P lyase system protein PhnG [Methanophagales archaeon]|nr:phosphonate C-P lyase system protein PhnG [Methanophagales archaeon]